MRLKRAMIGILTFVLLIGTIAAVPASEVSAARRAKISAKNLALNPGTARTLTVSGASGNVKWSTSNSSGTGDSAAELGRLCKGAKRTKALSVYDDDILNSRLKKKIDKWLKDIGA